MKSKIKIPDDMAIGSIHNTKNSGYLEIVKYDGWEKVEVRFIETGFLTVSHSTSIRCGEVKDLMKPSVFGVGFIGYGVHKAWSKGKDTNAYAVWHNMVVRCYSLKCQEKQPTYKGCTVCVEWHNFQNFADWFYDNYIAGYHLDKDIKVKGNKIYSPDTCMFVTQLENTTEANAKNYKFINPSGVLVEFYNLSKFCRVNDLLDSSMCSVHSGKRKHHKGWTKFNEVNK